MANRILPYEVKDKKGTVKKAQAELKGMGRVGADSAAAIAKGFISAQIAISAVRQIWGKTIELAKESIALSQKQIKAEEQLTAALKAKGQYTDDALKSLKAYTSELQRQVNVGDEAALQIGAQIEALTGLSDVALQKAIKATIQLAETQDMELKPAGLLIAKTLASQTNALTRYGVTIDMHADKEGRLQQVLDQTAAGWDMALAAANTYEGSIKDINNSWGDLLETAGDFITRNPSLIDAFHGIARAIDEANKSLGDYRTGVDAIFNTYTASMINAFAVGVVNTAKGIAMAGAVIKNTLSGANISQMGDAMQGVRDMFDPIIAQLGKAQLNIGLRYALGGAGSTTGGLGKPPSTAATGGGKGSAMSKAVAEGFMEAWAKLGFRMAPGQPAPFSPVYGHIGEGAGISALRGLAPPAYGTITGGGAGRWAGGPPVSYVNFGNAPAQARGPWWQSQTANYAAAGIGGFMSGGIGGAIGSLAGAAFGPLGSIAGGLLGGLFGKKKRQETPRVMQPIPVKVINWQDFGTAMLNVTKQARAGISGFGVDRLNDLRLARRAAGVR